MSAKERDTSTFPIAKNSEASAFGNIKISSRNLEKFEEIWIIFFMREKKTSSLDVRRFTHVEVIYVDDWEEIT
jgi:hypothetical protein